MDLRDESAGIKRRLIAFAVATLAVIWAAVAGDLWRLDRQAHAEAEAQTRAVALAMDEYVKRTLQAVDLALRAEANALARLGKPLRDSADEVERVLRGEQAAHVKAFSLAVFDAAGLGIAASEPGFGRGRSFADREYFRVHVDDPKLGLYVGPPLLGRTYGKRFFSLSRRIEGPNGKFVGVVMGSIDARYLAEYFANHAIGDGGTIALVNVPARRVVARVPDFETTFDTDVGGSELFRTQLDASPIGSYFQRSTVDGRKRRFAYRTVEGLPLVVVVGVAEDHIRRRIADVLPAYLSGLLLASLLVAGLALAMLRAQHRVAAALNLAGGMIEAAPIGIALYDAEDGHCVSANAAMAEILGIPRAGLAEHNYHRIDAWRDCGLYDVARRTVAGGAIERWDGAVRIARTQELWLSARLAAFEEAGRQRLLLMLENRSAERAATEELRLANKVIQSCSEAIMLTDMDNRIVSVNPAFEAITGYSANDVVGSNPRILMSGRHDKAFYAAMWESIRSTGHWEGEIWDRRKSGETYPKYLRIDVLLDEASGRAVNYVAMFADISERKASEERIRFLAHHDALTELPNRYALRLHLERALALARRERHGVALLFIDLDRFKAVNDTLGHHVGDRLLCEVAQRIRSAVRESDMVARLGGDEFVVVIEGVHKPADVAALAGKVLRQVGLPYVFDDRTLHTSPSVGVGLFPDDAADIDALMRCADAAMYHAKANGRNNVQFFAQPTNEAAHARLGIEAELRRALAGGELVLHYQPQFHLVGRRFSGVEALVRWQHPERGLVPPGEFVPLAEEVGLIEALDDWVLDAACRQAREWLAAGYEFGHIAVNIAAAHLSRRELIASVKQVLADSGLEPTRLALEVAESGLMRSGANALAVMDELKSLGVRLAIDDFGTGHSSLSCLKGLPVHDLKIDRSFVRNIETDDADAAIAQAVIALAHALGLQVVAEGVETPGQVQFLKERGCDCAQGYLYARPLPAAEVVKLIPRHS